MKRFVRNVAVASILGAALLAAPQATAQQRDVDFDWILNTVDTLIGNLAPTFNFPLAGVDNDSNGILDEDTLAALSLILRDGGRPGTGISAANIAQIQADFTSNRAAANDDMRVTGFNCFLVNAAGYPCRLIQLLDIDDILGGVVGPVVGELLLDLVAGYATVGDNPATFNAVNQFLDAVLEALKDTLDPTLAGFIDLVKNDLFIQPGNYNRWGANPSAAPRRNAFGAAGTLDNINGGGSNLVKYLAATDREAWFTSMGMIPPVRITTQPTDVTVQDGGSLNLTVNWVGGTPPFTVQWENAQNFADEDFPADYGLTVLTAPQNIGSTTTATFSQQVSLANDGLAPWLRITDAVTTYNTLPVVQGPSHPPIPATRPTGQTEYDGFGGRSSVFATVEVTPAPITAGVTPGGPINLVAGQNLNLTAIPGGGIPPYSFEWVFGTTAANMTPMVPAQTDVELNRANMQVANSGFYAVRVTADDGLDAKALQTVESTPVQVTVVNPPTVTGASIVGPQSITVTFSQPMNTGGGSAGAGNPNNYIASGPGRGSLSSIPNSASVSGNVATLTWNSGKMNVAGGITITVNESVQSAGGVPMGTPRVAATNPPPQSIRPTPVITPNQSEPTNANPVTFAVDFGETVTGFVSGDVTVTGGTASVSPSGNSATFTISVTPSGTSGTVSVQIPEGAANDQAGNPGNPSFASNLVTRNYDYVPPNPTVSSSAPNPTNTSPIPFSVNFGETVNGFGLGNIAVTNGTAGNLSPAGSASVYTFSVTPSGQGMVTVNINGAGVTDLAGNTSGNAGPAQCVFDTVDPVPVISTTASDPTDTSPIPFTVTFNEAVTGFINTDVVVTGGTRSGFTNQTPNTVWAFNVTPSGNGMIQVDLATGAANDFAGNPSVAASYSLEFFSPRPTVSLSSSAGGSGDLTNVDPIPIAVQFSTAVTGFDPIGEPSDVTIVNGNLTNFQDAGDGINFSFDVEPTVPAGTIEVTVNENAANDGVNGNFDATFEIDYDGVPPMVLSAHPQLPDWTVPTNTDSIVFTVTFSEPVTGFTQASVSAIPPVDGTATAGAPVDLGNGDVYTVEVSNITGDGQLFFLINPGTIQDAAGNLMVLQHFTDQPPLIDNTPPVITLLDPLPDTVDCGQGYTDPGATALDNVDGDVTGDIVVTGAGPVAFSPPGDYTITYTVTDTAGNVSTENRVITVEDNCPLAVTTNDAFVEKDAGESHTFEVGVTGNLGAVTFQWYKDGGGKSNTLLPGEESSTLTLTDLIVGDAGDYFCAVSDQVTTVNSATMTLVVLSGLPLAGIPALGGLALLLGAAGAVVLRRRR